MEYNFFRFGFKLVLRIHREIYYARNRLLKKKNKNCLYNIVCCTHIIQAEGKFSNVSILVWICITLIHFSPKLY